jgi:hypothetical protein
MTPLFWTVLAATIIILLYPAGFLAGFAKGRNTKVLTIVSDYLKGKEGADAPGDPETP